MRFRKRTNTILRSLLVLFCIGLFQMSSVVVSAATIPVTAMIPVAVTGENTDESFKCVLDMESTVFQIPEETELSLKQGQGGVFHIRYTYPGTYRYSISQKKGTDSRTSYDSAVYTVDVYVTEDENGQLHAEPVIFCKGNDEKMEGVNFRNIRTVPSNNTSRPGTVNTGDATDLFAYYALIGGSAIILILAGCAYKRRRG